ncbi:hypothetical protein [Breoghania sp.]|uniref:hypothetical protein n=1 Tax=Breoghania sp. TaxID=2065378 RepID=UPI00262C793B|nr:hypothetical protein [Breoghania sp.]MDJ0929744.1 hypothetical protein [Breoghania sp.]
MSDTAKDDKLVKQIQLRQKREHRGHGDVPISRRLAQIGVLGWIVVTPMLVGIFVDR